MIGNQDNITFPGNLPAVATLPLLRAIPAATLSGDTNVLVQGGSASGDGGGGAYIFKPSSTDADDGLRVIKPNDVTGLQAGRWKFIGALSAAAGPTGPANSTYATLAAMKSAPVSNRTYNLAASSGSDGGYINGPFTYRSGNFTGRPDVVQLNDVPITVGALVRPDANTSLYGDGRTNILLPLDRSIPRTLSYMGVDPFTSVSQTGSLISAFANATGDRLKLIGHPDAKYAKDAPVSIGFDFDGQGCTFLGSGNSNAVQLTGAGRTYKNFITLGAASVRTSADSTDGGIYCTATDFVLENVVASRVEEGKGHGAAAIFFAGAKRGTIRNSQALYSKADGHHCSDGCEDLTFENPTSIGVGDDGFAVVSYDYQGTINKRIHTNGLRAIDVKARGLSVLGCLDSFHRNSTIIRSSAAAVYIVSEGADSFNTLGCRNARVENLYAEYCVTGVDRPMLAQAIIIISGRTGNVTLSDGSVQSLGVHDPFVSGRVVGAGAVASYGLRSDSQYNYRPEYDLTLENISGPSTAAACVQLGGQDGQGSIVIEGCDGYPFLFMPTATGDHYYERLQAAGTRLKSQTINEALHGEGTNNFANIHVDLLKFPDTGLTPAGNMDLNKLTWRRFLVAGNVIAHP